LDLIITNGDAAGELLRRAIPRAEVLPWRDVLHEGPVPPTGTLAELTAIRAEYLADRGWGEREEIATYLQARDRGLAHSTAFDRVVLWFEHDLYDQLQLLQILDWFSREQMNADGSLLLVQASEFLGRQTEVEIEALRALEEPVTPEQLALAADAWAAFRTPTPERFQAFLRETFRPCPFSPPPCGACSRSCPAATASPEASGRSSALLAEASPLRRPCSLRCSGLSRPRSWETGASSACSMGLGSPASL